MIIGMAAHQPATPDAPALTPGAAAVHFALDGDLRFLSHNDERRMLMRALRRAGWPLAWSQGYNPQPRLTLPLPRSVGMASDCQCAIVGLEQPRAARELFDSLAPALPAGCRLRRVTLLWRRVCPRPRRVDCVVALGGADIARAAEGIGSLLAAEAVRVTRASGPGQAPRCLDIRPYIESVTLDGCRLTMRLVFVDQQSARPTEILTALRLPADVYGHGVRRVEVEWDMALAGPQSWPAGTERNDVGHQESSDTQAPAGCAG